MAVEGQRLKGAVDELIRTLPRTYLDYEPAIQEANRCIRSDGMDFRFSYHSLRQLLKPWRGKEANRVKHLFWNVMGFPPYIQGGNVRDPGLG